MSWKSLVNRVVKIGVNEGFKFLKESQAKKKAGPQGSGPRPNDPGRSGTGGADARSSDPASAGQSDYPGDYRGPVKVTYSPDLDGDADPGEVVWGWVPYEEDHSQGKDRPSLVVGKDGRWVLALMLTSQDHISGGVGEVREDRHARWMNIGSGDWDSHGRPSEIRLDRVIRLDPQSIRREGSIMPREIFEQIGRNVAAG